MTKRFTPKASTFTETLAEVQAQQRRLRAKLAALDERERSLKAFLMPFYETGKTEVRTLSNELTVSYTVNERVILNQEQAKAMLIKLGKKVPTTTVDIVTFSVKTGPHHRKAKASA